jgi:ADP-ribose pyrophosphatase
MPNKIKPWKMISEEIIFEKFGRGIKKTVFQQADGEQINVYLKKERDVVSVLPITDKKEIIMVKQFRPGPRMITLDLPGGIIDSEKVNLEKATATIKKELLEETGYKGELKFVTTVIEDGYSSRFKYTFVATNCKKIKEVSNDLRDNDDDGEMGFKEEKEVVLVSLKEFKALLRLGKFADVQVGYLGLDYLKLLCG